MLNPTEIQAATARLITSDRIKAVDVDSLVSAFRTVFGGLEQKYGYKFQEKLEAMRDADGQQRQQAAKMVAGLIRLEDLEFTGAALNPGTSRGGLSYSQDSEELAIILYLFSLMYPLPDEFSTYDLKRGSFSNGGGAALFSESIPVIH